MSQESFRSKYTYELEVPSLQEDTNPPPYGFPPVLFDMYLTCCLREFIGELFQVLLHYDASTGGQH